MNPFDLSDVADKANQAQLAFKIDAILALSSATMAEAVSYTHLDVYKRQAFESWSFGRIVQEPERFSHAIECMHRATPEQCKRLEYMEALSLIHI